MAPTICFVSHPKTFSYLVVPSLCIKPLATCSWFSKAHSYYSVQVWLIFTLWVPVWCIRISKQLMFLWMKTSLLRWQMLDSTTFWGELTLQAPLLKWQQMKYSLHQSNIYLYLLWIICAAVLVIYTHHALQGERVQTIFWKERCIQLWSIFAGIVKWERSKSITISGL